MSNLLSLFHSQNNLADQKSMDKLLQTNDLSSQYGLRLTSEDALELVQARNETLQGYGRLEFGKGVLEQLVLAFCDSPYLNEETYADSLLSFLELFYQTKNESMERMPDDLVIKRMKEAFNGSCEGSLKRLTIVMDTIAYNIRVYGSEVAPEEEKSSCTHQQHDTEEDDEEYTNYEGEEDENWRTVKF
mgnify:CR=1 FL=1